jgi:3-oxoadipate enol-lactonase
MEETPDESGPADVDVVHERTLPVNGIEMHVTHTGAGHPLLMLHGLTVDATFMHREVVEFGRTFRVIAPDLRGHGRTTRPSGFTLDDHVQDLLGLLDALSIESAHVMGTSMGSYIAQALAVQAPRRVDRLVLVVAKASGTSTSSARYLADHADELVDLSIEEQQRWITQRMFAPETSGTIRADATEWVIAQQRRGLALSAAQLKAANDALAGFDFRDDLPQLDVPTLVISGQHDILNPPEAGAEIARLVPGAQFEVFEHSGHMLPWEEPDHLVETVRTFLSRPPPQGS